MPEGFKEKLTFFMKSGLITKNWTFGSHDRRSFVGHLVGTKLLYRGLLINRGKFRCVFEDAAAEVLFKRGKITREMKEKYYDAAIEFLTTTDVLSTLSNEKLVWELHKLKVERLGLSTVRIGEQMTEEETREVISGGVTGIDDSDVLLRLREEKNVLFYVSEYTFLPAFSEECLAALSKGKKVAVVAASEEDGFIPTVRELKDAVSEDAGERITWISVEKTYGCMDFSKADTRSIPGFSPENFFLRGFGEDALMCARNLSVDTVVDLLPAGLPTRAVSNQFFFTGLSRIYVPREFDIIPFVPMVTPSKMTYYHLSYLRKKYGEKVYSMSPRELYALEGGLFFDFYSGTFPYEPEEGFRVLEGQDVATARCRFVEEKFSGRNGVTYRHAYLEKDSLAPAEEDYETDKKQHRVLADLCIADETARVHPVNFAGNISPREYLSTHPYAGEGLMTNFAFFFTNRLLSAYNAKRKERPQEQLPETTGFIDYFRYTDENGMRREAFPLYRKSCIAKTKEGRYVAFLQYLSSGEIRFAGGVSVSFTEEQLNPSEKELSAMEAALFTPMLSGEAREKPQDPEELTLFAESYREYVGANRLNLIIIGERVTAIREGDVMLPPIGVVLSLSGAKADEMRRMLSGGAEKAGDTFCAADGQGYYPVTALSERLFFSLSLKAPGGISQETFDSLEWAYGGLLGLIRKEKRMTPENYREMLSEEGWMTPLSVETQESRIHTVALHPRTAVGVTKKGEFFSLVISGRSLVSEGADYFDIVRIAEKTVPEIDFLINGDGGGSSFIAYIRKDRLTELNLTAPSEKSIAGLVRPVSSVIEIS